MQNNKYYIGIAVVVVIIVAVVLAVRFGASSPAAPAGITAVPAGQSPSATAPGAATLSPSTYAARSPASPTAPSPVSAKITITVPTANDQWILGTQNTITWSAAAGSPDGTITLVNASTGAVVGWIQQHIAPKQATFPWNTRDVFVSQTSPSAENISPGTYRIVLTFNSPNNPSVTSPTFSIIYPAEAQTLTTPVTIKSLSFSPSSMTVAQGTKLVFTNTDTKSYAITVSSGAPPFTVGSSAPQTFDTSVLPVGNYAFYSTAYPSLRLTVTIVARPQ